MSSFPNPSPAFTLPTTPIEGSGVVVLRVVVDAVEAEAAGADEAARA